MSAEKKTIRLESPHDFAAHFGVSRETIEKFEAYEALLRQWQKTINLVAPSTLDDMWHRHFADSAQLANLVRRPGRWIDLGAGAGFPGLVVALLLDGHPGFSMALVESDQRKAAFLREVARRTGTAVEILSIRVEQLATQFNLPPASVVSARALAPLPKLLSLAAPLLMEGAIGLFPKGRDVVRELAEAREHWSFECDLVESLTDADGRIAVMSHLAAKRGVEP